MTMNIEIVKTGIYLTNCYVIYDEHNKGIIIDPTDGSYKKIQSLIEDKSLEISDVILTHGHGDHIGDLQKLKDELDVNIHIHKEDAYLLKDKQKNLSARMGLNIELEPDNVLEDNDTLEVGTMEVRIIHTPGHTKGSISVLIDDTLFSGDTLFNRSIGRTDLEGGDKDKILGSIKEKLFILPESTKVYPGHGAPTSIKQEKMTNPFF